MSGSSLDGLDIAYVHLLETRGKWSFEIHHTSCIPYSSEWKGKLKNATALNAKEYLYLHSDYGKYIGELVNTFIEDNQLSHQVHLISSHGHTTFHDPAKQMTAQLGNGAAVAAVTGLPVISDLRAMDVAFGGQGAPIVPIGEKLLFEDYSFFLNLGGIANLSFHKKNDEAAVDVTAFDVCPCNRILNMLAEQQGVEFDMGGKIAAGGSVDESLLHQLNGLSYYQTNPPKSLDNNFGMDTIYPLLKTSGLSNENCMRTYVEHIIQQITISIKNNIDTVENVKLLITGGGALNTFLIEGLKKALGDISVSVDIPAEDVVQYKEALIMALIGVLRWREEINVLASVTGAAKDSIGGAFWLGSQV
jgi:anhydro-N-acetylmuramic acid kinase